MAFSNDYPILDGVAPSWADISAIASSNGSPLLTVKDFQSISTNTTVEVGVQRGASGGRVIRRTTGQVDFEASLVLYRTGYNELLRKLIPLAPQRGNQRAVSLVKFDIQVMHTPFGSEDVFEFRLMGCRLTGRALNPAEGTDAETVDCPISLVNIVDIVDGVEVVML